MNILIEADKIVTGSRQTDYGDCKVSFDKISKMASLLSNKELTPIDCANILLSVKLVRESYKHKTDNLIDVCGYTQILNDLNE